MTEMTGMLPLTARQSWTALQAHDEKIREPHLRAAADQDAGQARRGGHQSGDYEFGGHLVKSALGGSPR